MNIPEALIPHSVYDSISGKELVIMMSVKSLAEWMSDRGLSLENILQSSGLEKKVLDAILHDRYTPSPQQRQRLAAALGLAVDDITWGYRQQVDHMYGHGPQFGRSP